MNASPEVIIGTVVWGDAYVDLFEQVNIRSLLSPGNLPELAQQYSTRLLVITAPENYARLKSSPTLAKVAKKVDVEIDCVSLINDQQDKYIRSSAGQSILIARAAERGAWAILNAPDGVYGDGTYSTLAHHFKSSAKLIAAPSLQTKASEFRESFVSYFGSVTSSPSSVDPRTLVRQALDHPHGLHTAQTVGTESFSTWPSGLNWQVENSGILARHFHAAIIAVRPDVPTAIGDTVDLSYPMTLVRSPDDYRYLNDSDQCCIVNMNSGPMGYLTGYPADPTRIADFMELYTTKLHRNFARVPCRFRFEEGNASQWKRTENESAAFLNQCEQQLATRYVKGAARADSLLD